jgi:hypothetical protein
MHTEFPKLARSQIGLTLPASVPLMFTLTPHSIYNCSAVILAILFIFSMNPKNILKVKRPTKPQTQPPPLNDSAIEEAVEALQQSAMETLQQPEPVVNLEVFLGTPRDESVYGCGWSLTELLNEFNER